MGQEDPKWVSLNKSGGSYVTYHMENPPDRQTRLKTLPSRKLRMWRLFAECTNFIYSSRLSYFGNLGMLCIQ